MKEIQKIKIPEYISYNIYKTSRETRIYISDEFRHIYYLLTDISALFFEQIIKKESIDILIQFAKKNNIKESELSSFINELSSIGIIEIKNNKYIEKKELKKTNKYPVEDNPFIAEMQKWIFKENFMYGLFIEMTYRCNLNCVHCYNDKKENHKEITFDRIKQVIDDSVELGVFNIILSGGECTITKDFLKIAKYIRKKRVPLQILTNGQELYDNAKLFNELIKIYPTCISISLYSMNPEIHDKITGVKGSHYKTVEVIKKLKENNIEVLIKCFVTSINANEYKSVAFYAEKLNIGFLLDSDFVNNPSRNNSHTQCTDEELRKLYNDKIGQKLSDKGIFEVKKGNNHKICRAGESSLCIAPDNNVYPCPTLKIELGNTNKTSIKEIWRKLKNNSFADIEKLTKNNLKECFKEEYCKFCKYCPGVADSNMKFLKKYEPFCNTAKIRMEANEFVI